MTKKKNKWLGKSILALLGVGIFGCGTTGTVEDSALTGEEGSLAQTRIFEWPSQSLWGKLFPEPPEIFDTLKGQEQATKTGIGIPRFLFASEGAKFQASLNYAHPADLKVWLIHNLQSGWVSNQPSSIKADQILYADLSVDLPQSLTVIRCDERPDVTDCQSASPNQIILKADLSKGPVGGDWNLFVMDANTFPQPAAEGPVADGRVVRWNIEVLGPKTKIDLPFFADEEELTPWVEDDFSGPAVAHEFGNYDADWELVENVFLGNLGKQMELTNGEQILKLKKGLLTLQRQFGDVGGKILRMEHAFQGGGKDSFYVIIAVLEDGYESIIQHYSLQFDGTEFIKLPEGTQAIKFMLYAQDEEKVSQLTLRDFSIWETQATCGDLVCSDIEEDVLSCPNDCARSMALVVESQLLNELRPWLTQYISDLKAEGLEVWLSEFGGGTVDDLRNFLHVEKMTHGIQGALLVGQLPVAQVRLFSRGLLETFPSDAYLEDLTAPWIDFDADGLFDGHGLLQFQLYVARLKGSVAELQAYFDRVHRYRTEGHLLPPQALAFKDDDWIEWQTGSDYGLEALYSRLDKYETEDLTTRERYLERLGQGVEYLVQWIHGYSPNTLALKENETFVYLSTDEIRSLPTPIQASFYFLYTCMAADLNQDNLAMTYVVQTPAGLAALGSSRSFGSYSGEENLFHQELAMGRSWGNAYVHWFNAYSSDNFLGMILVGDPTLRVFGDTQEPH